ncbi:MAG: hypothetical protein AB8B99_04125 [Phormidesmis sp.]
MKHFIAHPFHRLCRLTVCSWCALLAVGLAIKLLLPLPAITLLLDRSYCNPDQWQQVSRAYTQLYQQHQQQRSRLERVVVFSNLNQTNYDHPPHPTTVKTLATYGQYDPQRQATLEETYPNTTVLSCHTSP